MKKLFIFTILLVLSTSCTPAALAPVETTTPSPRPTFTLRPTYTLTQTPTLCNPPTLELPFKPQDLNHSTFQDGSRRYGIYWFDVDPSEIHEDWRGLRDTYDGHRGTDFSMDIGLPIYASASGEVVRIEGMNGSPRKSRVVTDIGCGYYLAYHHIDPQVELGQTIQVGELVGTINDEVPDPHLHFQLEQGPLTGCQFLRGDFACPLDVMTSGLFSKDAIDRLSSMPEIAGYQIPGFWNQ